MNDRKVFKLIGQKEDIHPPIRAGEMEMKDMSEYKIRVAISINDELVVLECDDILKTRTTSDGEVYDECWIEEELTEFEIWRGTDESCSFYADPDGNWGAGVYDITILYSPEVSFGYYGTEYDVDFDLLDKKKIL